MNLMKRLPACLAVFVLMPACASPSGSPSNGAALPSVWAVGPDRLLELDPNAKVSTSILPMYAGTDRSERVIAMADKDFIAKTSAAFGGRENASKEWTRVGLKYYDQNLYEKAMMRLNQAWLLDETNPDVFYGFAAVYQDHQNYVEAGGFAETSLKLGQEVPRRVADCAYLMATREGARTTLGGEGEALPRPAPPHPHAGA